MTASRIKHVYYAGAADSILPEMQEMSTDRLLRLPDVIKAAGLGKTMIYRLIRQGRFPQPYKPGGHASRWSERELIEWQGSIERRRL